jgi:branched-chain amino acid transport system substrate-binding protein
LGGACSSETLAIAPIAEDAHVIVLSSFSSNPQISTAGDYIFRNAPSDADVAKTDATYIASHFKNAGLISENTDYTQGVRSVMKEVLAKANVPVVADELFGGPGIAVDDFRTVLQGVKAKNPEVIYINAQTGKTGARILKQMRDLGIRIPVTSNLNLGGADAIAIAGSYTDGIVISDSTKLSDKGQSLLKKYKDTYNSDPINQFEMAASYDRAYIIAQAIKAVGTDATKIKDYLYSMKEYTGAVGTYHFDENGDVVGVGFANFVIKDGKEIPVIK